MCKVYPGVTDHPDFTGDSGLGFKLKERTGLCPRDQDLCLREQNSVRGSCFAGGYEPRVEQLSGTEPD